MAAMSKFLWAVAFRDAGVARQAARPPIRHFYSSTRRVDPDFPPTSAISTGNAKACTKKPKSRKPGVQIKFSSEPSHDLILHYGVHKIKADFDGCADRDSREMNTLHQSTLMQLRDPVSAGYFFDAAQPTSGVEVQSREQIVQPWWMEGETSKDYGPKAEIAILMRKADDLATARKLPWTGPWHLRSTYLEQNCISVQSRSQVQTLIPLPILVLPPPPPYRSRSSFPTSVSAAHSPASFFPLGSSRGLPFSHPPCPRFGPRTVTHGYRGHPDGAVILTRPPFLLQEAVSIIGRWQLNASKLLFEYLILFYADFLVCAALIPLGYQRPLIHPRFDNTANSTGPRIIHQQQPARSSRFVVCIATSLQSQPKAYQSPSSTAVTGCLVARLKPTVSKAQT
ncbi:hypothetical protein SODALDRAFT_354216 [Sodiomyces alkalinus F11]|uniref:Uncharacterized protein n=1 Tax=Sodiomyces alkalinus (strain CBS 110278 / VKM F-3762 / F11) TaxID=1314773 RepID=A0A3N2Q615_SODAK|nr:hypothetical protein SODALDRAFT_354216 [Sodiomyces alkalinus F11]ROT42098.1 hypothetical protein SODALDRAFT_354216 [Sodiomyces alkalinus F11]